MVCDLVLPSRARRRVGDPARVRVRGQALGARVHHGADIEKRSPRDHTTPLGSCVDALSWSYSKNSESLEIARILLRAGASLDRVKGDLPAEQVLANTFPPK